MSVNKTVFLFPGQGPKSIQAGMSRSFIKLDWAKEMFDVASSILGLPLAEICLSDSNGRLSETTVAQPASFVVNVIYARFLNGLGISPDYFAGFSIGYIAALVCSRVISFEEGLAIIKERSRLMSEACNKTPGSMVALICPINVKVIENICKKHEVEVANYCADWQLVVAGKFPLINRAVEEIIERKLARRSVSVETEGAFHTECMKRVKKPLKKFLKKIPFGDPRPYIIANSTAEIIVSGKQAKTEAVEQVCSSVLWRQSMAGLIKRGARTFYEVGHGKVLLSFLREFREYIKVFSAQKMLDETA